MYKRLFFALCASVLLSACDEQAEEKPLEVDEDTRIVSLNGSVSEILVGFGLEDKIVGVDVTSTYPASLKELENLGHVRNLTAEGILSLEPTLVLGTANEVSPDALEQLRQAGIAVYLPEQEYSVNGTENLITALADTLNMDEKGQEMIEGIRSKLETVEKPSEAPSVLFIYARGAGTMMVAGEGTQMQTMIELAGGRNAVSGFSDFKPLNAEALVEANPDVILMFESGIQSLNGIEGLLEVPGVAQTEAGKNKRLITMDGQYLSGFGPRLGDAVKELAEKLSAVEA